MLGEKAPQGTVAANITVVRTAEELQAATLRGATDIEIRSHVDLRSLSKGPNPAVHELKSGRYLALLYASTPLRSIRVCPAACTSLHHRKQQLYLKYKWACGRSEKPGLWHRTITMGLSDCV